MPYIEHGNGRPWHKRVLIPFWLIEIVFMGINVAAAAISIYLNTNVSTTVYYNTASGDNVTTYNNGTININGTNGVYNFSYSNVNHTSIIAIYSIVLAIATLGILFSFCEIVLFARHHLTPTKYFASNLFKFLCWTAMFILGLVNTVLYGSYLWTLIVSILVELTFLGSLIYGSVIFHRYRKGQRFDGSQGKAYAPAPMGVSNPGYAANQNRGNASYA